MVAEVRRDGSRSLWHGAGVRWAFLERDCSGSCPDLFALHSPTLVGRRVPCIVSNGGGYPRDALAGSAQDRRRAEVFDGPWRPTAFTAATLRVAGGYAGTRARPGAATVDRRRRFHRTNVAGLLDAVARAVSPHSYRSVCPDSHLGVRSGDSAAGGSVRGTDYLDGCGRTTLPVRPKGAG